MVKIPDPKRSRITALTNYIKSSPLTLQENAILPALKEILAAGFREDIGFGDLTSSYALSGQKQNGSFSVKAPGTLSGTGCIKAGYHLLDSSITIRLLKKDGDTVQPGETIAEVQGPDHTLLTGERVILNMMQHMCGIATATAIAVEELRGSPVRICDTRKTLPGFRGIQKYAVRCGGGYNHRMRLDDGVMIKDNHIAAAGSIKKAMEAVREEIGLMVKVEVECQDDKQVREAVLAGADIIMLDNKTPEEAKKLCRDIPPDITVELSGGITPQTVHSYRDCGAHYISLGSLTHSVQALDISFNLD